MVQIIDYIVIDLRVQKEVVYSKKKKSKARKEKKTGAIHQTSF